MTDITKLEVKRGFILRCDTNGVVLSIERDDIGLELNPPFLFTRLIEYNSLTKALSFLADLHRTGTALNWELVLNNAPQVLHFSGILIQDKLVIIASENSQETQKLFEELIVMLNEQSATLRAVIKEQQLESSLYDEISKLNNELVTLQRELAKKNSELEFLNKQKNQFLGMAAHDLRNPLHGILLQCDYLDAVIENPEHREIIGAIKEASNFMGTLIDDLLDYASIESGSVHLEYEQVDVVKLVQNNIRINKMMAARNQLDITFYSDTLKPVYTDPAKINQILNNLLSNAIKFSKEGQSIEVYVSDKGSRFELTVTDHGKGMSQAQQEKLFKPFTRGERGLHGERTTGLGLTIVKRIIDALGGTISITSKEGEGSTFTVLLPKIPPDLTAN
jgi:signal transduction histidine kinase